MVLVTSGFHVPKNFSENYALFAHAPIQTLASPVLGRKSLRNVALKGGQIISLSGVPNYYPILGAHMFRPDLVITQN